MQSYSFIIFMFVILKGVLVRLSGYVTILSMIPYGAQWYHNEYWLSGRKEKIIYGWGKNGMIVWRMFFILSQLRAGRQLALQHGWAVFCWKKALNEVSQQSTRHWCWGDVSRGSTGGSPPTPPSLRSLFTQNNSDEAS